MSFTRLQTKEHLEGMLHSTSLNKVTNLSSLLERAGRNLISKIDPEETIRIAQITNKVHDDIFDYSCPSDLKGRKVLDIRPQINRNEGDSFQQLHSKEFDMFKDSDTFEIRWNNGVKSLRLSKDVTPSPTTLHEMDSITSNGTWAVNGKASNLTLDTNNYVSGSGCLNFDLDSAGSSTSGGILVTDMTAVDLSDEDEIGTFFVWVYLPNISIITSIYLWWGNDTSNYWTSLATSAHDQTSFKTGWNLVKFAWNGATETGTVDPATINYLRVTINYDGTAETDIRVDKIIVSTGEIFEIEYYSKYLFTNSGGTRQGTFSDDADIVVLEDDAFNIYTNECGLLLSQQQKGKDSRVDELFFRKELYGDQTSPTTEGRMGLYKAYKVDHPAESIKPKGFYYRL